MKQIATQGIVLARINYGEADRIITVLTIDQGKIRLLAKGVRKIKSKMAGGIELFSVNDLTYIAGKGDMGTLISSRVKTNFGKIINDITRTMFAYETLKQINKITQDSPEPEYFEVLRKVLYALNDDQVTLDHIQLWQNLQLLHIEGHAPNLRTDTEGKPLDARASYQFDFDTMSFAEQPHAPLNVYHIKLLRLAERLDQPEKLIKVHIPDEVLSVVAQLVKTMYRQNTQI